MRCKLTCAYCLDSGDGYDVEASTRKDAVEMMEGHIRKWHSPNAGDKK